MANVTENNFIALPKKSILNYFYLNLKVHKMSGVILLSEMLYEKWSDVDVSPSQEQCSSEVSETDTSPTTSLHCDASHAPTGGRSINLHPFVEECVII